jgi:hypothetical protein
MHQAADAREPPGTVRKSRHALFASPPQIDKVDVIAAKLS